MNIKGECLLTICRDFHGHENDIDMSLKNLLENVLGLSIRTPMHQRLPDQSKAHQYAYLMSKDTENQFPYVSINLEDIEMFLKKKTPKNKV